MIRKCVPLSLMGIALLIPAFTNAQTPQKGATILAGTVIGLDGKPVPHAAVSCQSSGGFAPHAVYTNSKGKFVIAGLRQDSYDLRASFKGVNSDWQRFVYVKKGQTKEVTLHLELDSEPPLAMPVRQKAHATPK